MPPILGTNWLFKPPSLRGLGAETLWVTATNAMGAITPVWRCRILMILTTDFLQRIGIPVRLGFGVGDFNESRCVVDRETQSDAI
jgi:hypothetical protein